MTDLARLVLDADTKGLKNAERDLESLTGKAGQTAKRIGASMMKVGAGLTAGVTAPLAFFAKGAAQAAIDAQEMESAFDVVFGNMAGDVRKWAEVTGDAMGRSTQEIQRGALAFQELFGKALDPRKAAAMSKEFAVLTQDLASFKNLSNEVAQQKLFSGLTGEAEPLRAVGVFINEAAVQAKALELGLTGVNGKLTDQEKIVARAAIIQEQLAQASGDVGRTSEGTANQIKASAAAFEELQVTIGTKLLPVITPIISGIGDLLNKFTKLPDSVQTTILVFAGLAAALGPLLIALGAIVTLAPGIVAGLGLIAGAASVLALNPAVLAFAAVLGGVYLVWKNWETIGPILEGLWKSVSESIGPPFMALVDSAKAALTSFWEGPFGELARTIIPLVVEFAAKVGQFWGGNIVTIIKTMADVIGFGFKSIGAAINLLVSIFDGTLRVKTIDAVRKTYEGVKIWLQDKLGAIFDWVGRKVGQVTGFFKDMYVAVVGNSYVPDMVDEIGQNMARLDGLLVAPAQTAAAAATEAFTDMAGEVKGFADESLASMGEQTEVQTVRIADSFKTMADNVLGSIRGLVSSIKGGGFLDILGSVIDVFLQLGGAGAFGSKIQTNINKPIEARAAGGPVNGGQTYLVGERGPELFTAPGAGRIVANDNMGGGPMNISVEASPYFDVRVNGQIVKAAPALANAGAQQAMAVSARAGRRTVRR